MANQFDKPSGSQFINTYVPIPFEQMAGALQNRQRQYETTAARIDATFSALKDVEAHRLDEPGYQAKINELQKRVSDFQKENPDLSTLEARTGMNQLLQEQTRDPYWRALKANAPVLQEIEKQVALARSENRPWDAMDAENFLQQYGTGGGAATFGKVGPVNVAEATDINALLESIGRGFIVEGTSVKYNNETGTEEIDQSKSGISPQQVSNAYGLSINDGQLQLDNIPTKILTSPDFATLRNVSKWQAAQDPNLSFEEALAQNYYSAVAPMVDKYSGYKVSSGQRLTSKGLDDKDRGTSFEFFTNLGARNFGGEGYNMPKHGGMLKLWAMFDKVMPFTGMAGVAQAAISSTIRKNTEDIVTESQNKGLSVEETLTAIETTGESQANALKASGQYISAFGIQKANAAQRLMVESLYIPNRAPGKPSDDYLSVADNILSNTIKYGTDDYTKLSNKQKNDLHKEVGKYVAEWAKRAVHIPVRQVDIDTKAEMQSKLFGFANDGGKIELNRVSGPISQMKVFNPEEPNSEMPFNDYIKKYGKDAGLDYIGSVGYTNDFAAGLHAVNIDGDMLFVQVPKINTTNSQLEGRDMLHEQINFMLNDGRRNPSGKGDWFEHSGHMIREVVDESDSEGNPIEVHLEYVPVEEFTLTKRRGAIANAQRTKQGGDPVQLYSTLLPTLQSK